MKAKTKIKKKVTKKRPIPKPKTKAKAKKAVPKKPRIKPKPVKPVEMTPPPPAIPFQTHQPLREDCSQRHMVDDAVSSVALDGDTVCETTEEINELPVSVAEGLAMDDHEVTEEELREEADVDDLPLDGISPDEIIEEELDLIPAEAGEPTEDDLAAEVADAQLAELAAAEEDANLANEQASEAADARD